MAAQSQQYAATRFALIIIMSLSALVTVLILLFMYTGVDSQKGDASVINVAGRQRMLSQKMTKEALAALTSPDQTTKDNYRAKLD